MRMDCKDMNGVQLSGGHVGHLSNSSSSLCLKTAGDDSSTTSTLDPGKMFIGGLSWQTTTEGLRQYFSRFGELADCMVMKDPVTKRSRGFGFVNYIDPDSVEKVLASGPHTLDTKVVDPKVAVPRPKNSELTTKGSGVEYSPNQKMIMRTKKIFIGGLSATTTVEDVKAYFEQHGKVEDAMLMFDKQTQRHRGFAFVTFESEDVVDKVIDQHFHEINNKLVECKKAQPKEVMLTQGLARGVIPVGLPQAYYTAATLGGRGFQIAGLPGVYYATGLPTYGYLPTAAGSATTLSDRLQSSANPGTYFATTGNAGDYGAALAAHQLATAMGHHVMAVPRNPESATSPPIHREQYIIQRTVQSAGGGGGNTGRFGAGGTGSLLSLHDYAGTDIILNGYGSSFASPTSPIASPTVGGLYGTSINGPATLQGYVQATSPVQSMSAFAFAVDSCGCIPTSDPWDYEEYDTNYS